MKRIILLLLSLYCMALPAVENKGYRIVHPDGTVEFTDDATKGGEEIKLRDVQTVGTPDREGEGEGGSRSVRKNEDADKVTKKPGYTALNITFPANNATLWFDERGMNVSISVSPKLDDNDTVVIEIDGVPRGRGNTTNLNVGLVYRGTHTVKANIVDSQGKTLISSSEVIFHLRQRSNN